MPARLARPAALALALAAGAPAAPTAALEVSDLGHGIYCLRGKGGNLALSVGADGVFLVDDQYATETPAIRAAIARLAGPGASPRFVINTHWHGDHTGGNEAFGAAGAVLVAHENVRKRLRVDQVIAAFGKEVPASPPAALPQVTFAEGVDFHLNGQHVEVRHLAPAHTDGDSFVRFMPADVLHLGDTFFNGFYPFIDGSSGGNLDGMIAAATRALGVAGPETKIIPGHGPVATRADLVAYRDMLAGVRDALAPLLAEGLGEDEIVAAKPTAAYDEAWGGGFLPPEKWVRILVQAARPPPASEPSLAAIERALTDYFTRRAGPGEAPELREFRVVQPDPDRAGWFRIDASVAPHPDLDGSPECVTVDPAAGEVKPDACG